MALEESGEKSRYRNERRIYEGLVEARSLADEGRFSEALAVLDPLAKEFPNDASVAYELANVIYRHVPHYEGLLAANAFVKRFPDNPYGVLLQVSANICLRRGKVALERLEVAERLGAAKADVNALRARALVLVGRRLEALHLVSSGSDLESLRAKFLIEAPRSGSDLEIALADLEAAGESPAGLAIRKSGWLSRHRQWTEAVACLNDAIDKIPNTSELQEQLAGVQFKMGDLDAAGRTCQEILSKTPENVRARSRLAFVAFRQGRILIGLREFFRSCKYGLRPRRLLP